MDQASNQNPKPFLWTAAARSIFWLADSLFLTGQREDAEQLFERLLTLRNDVGLLSKGYDRHAKRLVGNFPQALSHIALVNTARNLTRLEKPARRRSGASSH
jgi:GH15 family glucan-1,4-alpha-glucosidase